MNIDQSESIFNIEYDQLDIKQLIDYLKMVKFY